jgi:putative ABC transport system permease protein
LSSMEAAGFGEALFQPIPKASPWQPRLTYLIAWRNLVHDRMRFAVTLTGIAFSTLLMGIQLGMLLNFMHTTSILVDHAGADLWITAHGVRTVDLATPIEERRRFQALKVAGVAAAEPYLLGFGFWKRTDGVRETVLMIGINPDATMGKPWNLPEEADAREMMLSPDGAIVDRLYAEKLSVGGVGELFEINDHRVRVAGFTSGIRTFTQSPYVFMSLRHARAMAFAQEADPVTYVLVRVADGYAAEAVAAELREKLPGVDVLMADEFSQRSRNYWLFSTGAGITVISGAVLALFVGVVIAAQTLYASTMDRLPEYATIRAMGGPRSYLYAIVLKQALIGGGLGYLVGIVIALVLVYAGRDASAAPEMTWWLALGIGAVIELMCAAASIVSLNKVTAIDPVEVFR